MQFAHARKKKLPVFGASKKVARQLKLGWRTYLWGAFFIVLIAGLVYLSFWSPLLKIRKINVNVTGDNFNDQAKVEAVVRETLNQKIWRFIPGDSFFIISTQAIKEKIEKIFPETENVAVRQDIKDGLKISLAGRQAAAIWCQGQKLGENASASPIVIDSLVEIASTTPTEEVTLWQLPEVEKCFFVDKNSFVFREAPEISGTILPTFYDQTNREINLGSIASASSTIEFADLIQKTMKEDGVGFRGFLINNINNPDIIALTLEGWQIYFDLNRSAQAPLKVLDTLLNGDLAEKRASLKYIDLRTANRVYYK